MKDVKDEMDVIHHHHPQLSPFPFSTPNSSQRAHARVEDNGKSRLSRLSCLFDHE
jgi:hypothetical protein